MSQIFDAIHRSESARRGGKFSGSVAARELLEAAERQLGQAQRGSTVQPEPAGEDFSQLPSTPVDTSPFTALVCATDRECLAAEKFRYLGVRLRQLQQKRPINRLLITSTLPEEGKSTVAANLAITLAARGLQKILLLEGDLRRPSLTGLFGLERCAGLSEWLQGETSATMNVCRLENLGFWLLPAGSPPDDPLTLLQSEKLSELLDPLQSWFDWIIIDSPPVLPLGDTSVWMRLCDATLLVTRPGKTEKRQLQRTLEAVEQTKLLGALVNGSTETGASNYYHYYAGKPQLPYPSKHPPTSS